MFIHDVTCSYTKMFIQEQRMFSSWRTYSYALKIPAGKWTISKTTAPTPIHPVTFKTVPREEWGSRLLAAPVGADTLIDHWAVGEPPVTNASSIFNLALKKWSSAVGEIGCKTTPVPLWGLQYSSVPLREVS